MKNLILSLFFFISICNAYSQSFTRGKYGYIIITFQHYKSNHWESVFYFSDAMEISSKGGDQENNPTYEWFQSKIINEYKEDMSNLYPTESFLVDRDFLNHPNNSKPFNTLNEALDSRTNELSKNYRQNNISVHGTWLTTAKANTPSNDSKLNQAADEVKKEPSPEVRPKEETKRLDFKTSDMNTMKPIVFSNGSAEGLFLESENKNFNIGLETINRKEETKKEESSEYEEQTTYVHSSAKAVVNEYHPEPPVTQILDESVKEKKKEKWEETNLLGYTKAEWARYLAGLAISDKNIEDPTIRDLIERNKETIESFDNRIDNVMTTMSEVKDGNEASDKLDKELDLLPSGLQEDIMDSHVYSRVDEVKSSIQNEAVNAIEEEIPEVKPIREIINAAATILDLPNGEKEDENEN